VGLDVEVPKDVDNWTATLAGRHRMDSQTAIKACPTPTACTIVSKILLSARKANPGITSNLKLRQCDTE
jgi:predicted fused transcriptional regulator/phosphomethylpyrimidine kinase